MVVEQRGEGETWKRVVVGVQPGGKIRELHAAARERVPDDVSEIEIEDRVDSSRVAGEPGELAGCLGEHEGVGLDLAQPSPQLDPERGVHADRVVAPHAVRPVLGNPVSGCVDQVVLHAAAAGVHLGQGDHVVEAAVVMRPLPESVEVRSVAAVIDRVSEQVMTATRVVRHEVEQHAHAPGVRRIDQLFQRGLTAVSLLDLEEVLMVIAVVGGRLVDRRQPDRVAANARDVIQLRAHAVERASVQSG